MSRVFISYSRKDVTVVRRLYDGLAQLEVQAWVDWEGIPPADDWLRKIEAAIEGADTFVFVLSPDSLASEVCAKELAHALTHHKRLVPVVVRDSDAGDTPIPEALRRLNWVFLREQDDFDAGVGRLTSAVHTDLAWVQAHTRLLGRAIEWEAAGRGDSFVLQKLDLVSAEQWLASGPDKDPRPTVLQSEYILASRNAATLRQRRLTTAALVAAGLVLLGAMVATGQYLRAEIRREQGLSQQLAAQSASYLQDDPTLGLLLAVHAHDIAPTLEASDALLSALERVPSVRRFLHGDFLPGVLALSGDGSLLALGRCMRSDADNGCTKATLDLWRLSDEAPWLVAQAPLDAGALSLRFSPDTRSIGIAIAAGENTPQREAVYRIGDDPAKPGARVLGLVSEREVPEGEAPNAERLFGDTASLHAQRSLRDRLRRAVGASASSMTVMASARASATRALVTLPLGAMNEPVRVQLWDASSVAPRLRVQATLSSHLWGSTGLRADGRLAAAFGCAFATSGRICDDGQLVILEDTGNEPRQATISLREPDWIRAMAVMPEGEPWVISGGCGHYAYQNCRQGALRLWDAGQDGSAWTALEPLPVFGGAVESIAVAADGGTMALITQRGRASVWGLRELGADRDGWLLSALDAPIGADASAPAGAGRQGQVSAALAPAASALVSPAGVPAGAPMVCDGWSITDIPLRRLAQHLASPAALCGALTLGAGERATADASGQRLAVAACTRRQGDVCVAGRTTLWAVVDRRLVEQATVDTPAAVTALAFAPGGARLALASCDGENPQECTQARLEILELSPGGLQRRTIAQGGARLGRWPFVATAGYSPTVAARGWKTRVPCAAARLARFAY